MKRRTLLLSFTMLALAIATFASATFALFTDSVTLNTHLKAGNLAVTITRTNLETKVLDSNGLLETKRYEQDVDFTKDNNLNFFEVSDSTLIVPGSKFTAELLIANKANVAFDYYVEVVFKGGDLELAKQLQVTVDNGTTTSAKIEDGVTLGDENAPLGQLIKGASKTFYITVEFLDLTNNNVAQGKNVQCDLIVHAVQSTTSRQ